MAQTKTKVSRVLSRHVRCSFMHGMARVAKNAHWIDPAPTTQPPWKLKIVVSSIHLCCRLACIYAGYWHRWEFELPSCRSQWLPSYFTNIPWRGKECRLKLSSTARKAHKTRSHRLLGSFPHKAMQACIFRSKSYLNPTSQATNQAGYDINEVPPTRQEIPS